MSAFPESSVKNPVCGSLGQQVSFLAQTVIWFGSKAWGAGVQVRGREAGSHFDTGKRTQTLLPSDTHLEHTKFFLEPSGTSTIFTQHWVDGSGCGGPLPGGAGCATGLLSFKDPNLHLQEAFLD